MSDTDRNRIAFESWMLRESNERLAAALADAEEMQQEAWDAEAEMRRQLDEVSCFASELLELLGACADAQASPLRPIVDRLMDKADSLGVELP